MNTKRVFAVALPLFIFSFASFGASPARTVGLSEDEVFSVKTALGYSTILQFDSKPTSVVLGDQDSFKIEYVGSSLTIKPLRVGVTTNLFVFTDYDRFNFRLTAGTLNADYVLHIRKKGMVAAATPALPERKSVLNLDVQELGLSNSSNGLTLRIQSLAYPASRTALVVEFSVHCVDGKPIHPSQLSLEQNGTVPFQEIHLSKDGQGVFVVRAAKLSANEPFSLRCTAADGNSVTLEIDPAKPKKRSSP